MLSAFKNYKVFYASILFGVLVWVLSYVVTPATAVEQIKTQTVLFFLACYTALFLGFKLINFKTKVAFKTINDLRLIKALIGFLALCFILRWIDLVYLRDLSFSNGFIKNRALSVSSSHANIIFILASVFKSAYFFPFVMVLQRKQKSSVLLLGALVLLFFPIVEALMLGTRKPFFELFFIIIISLLIFKKIKFNILNIVIGFVAVFLLMTISFKVLFKREADKGIQKDFYAAITNARYNDLLQPNDALVNYINSPNTKSVYKNYALILLQTGQYINHGVLEFNHIIDKDILVAYGEYSFYPFYKFFNKVVLQEKYKKHNNSPRAYVYLTAFGSFYLDFGWASVIFFFILGGIQKYFYISSKHGILHSPILVYLAIFNVFLPIFNYLRGSGIYPFIGFAFLFIFYQFFIKALNEKSTST